MRKDNIRTHVVLSLVVNVAFVACIIAKHVYQVDNTLINLAVWPGALLLFAPLVVYLINNVVDAIYFGLRKK